MIHCGTFAGDAEKVPMEGKQSRLARTWYIVRLGCDACKRAGSYRLARLAVKYGAEISAIVAVKPANKAARPIAEQSAAEPAAAEPVQHGRYRIDLAEARRLAAL